MTEFEWNTLKFKRFLEISEVLELGDGFLTAEITKQFTQIPAPDKSMKGKIIQDVIE